MSSSESSGDIYAETLAVFDRRDDPAEPLTTPEVADTLDVARRTVYKRLDKLVSRGDLKTKEVGAKARVWWRPLDLSAQTAHAGDSSPRQQDLESTTDEVFERITDGFYGLDEQFRFTYLNTRAEALLDVEESTVLGESIHDELVLTDEFETALHEACETQEPVFLEDYYDPLDAWFENAIYPSETGLSICFRDISQRKRRENQLEEHQTIVETVGDGVFTVDATNRFTMVNQAYANMLGYTREELVGTHASQVASAEYYTEGAYLKANLGGVGDVAQHELELETKNGDTIPVEVRFSLLPASEGDEHGVVAVVRDITDRKRAEETIRENEAWLSEILEQLPAAVGVFDSDGHFRLQNERMRELAMGDRIPSRNSETRDKWFAVDDEGERLPPEQWPGIRAARGEAVSPGIEFRFEGDDETRWMDVAALPISGSGERTEVSVVIQDITEQKRREEELAALNRLNSVFQDVTHAIIESSSREEIEQTITEHLTNSDSYEYAWMGHLDRHGENVVPRVTGTNEAEFSEISLSSTTDDSPDLLPAAEALRTGEVQVTYDNTADPVLDQWKQSQDSRHRARISIPIAYEDRVYGVLNVYTSRENAFDEHERHILRRIGEVVGHAISAIERKQALLEDRVQEITFRSHQFAEIFTNAAGNESFTLSIDKFVPLPDDRNIAYYSLDGIDPAVFTDVIETYNPNAEYHVTDDEGSQTRVEVQGSDLTLASELAKYNSRLVDGSLQDGEFRLRVQVPQHAHVREVKEMVKEAFPDVEVVAQTEVERQTPNLSDVFSVLDDQLTDRQRTVLEVAYRSGFFDWPRTITGEELAERLDVTQATVSHHLRHGERKLVAAFFDAGEYSEA